MDAIALPPVETLTIDSDFTAFLQPKVDEALKRQALKQLFRDPRFNVMDGLDVYIDDYSICEPIAPDVVRQLVQGRYIFDPPATRVNEQGTVEDVPPDAVAERADGTTDASADAAPEASSESVAGASIEVLPTATAVPDEVPGTDAAGGTTATDAALPPASRRTARLPR